MTTNLPKLIAELRLLVGYLGEKSQKNWWESNFLGASSQAYLMPTFPRTVLLAQYQGVLEAALLVHDEFVGVGSNYHLFRLPLSIERSTAEAVRDLEIHDYIKSEGSALARLAELTEGAQSSEGPVNIGTFKDENLEHLIYTAAGIYLQAFRANIKSFPFMRGENGE